MENRKFSEQELKRIWSFLVETFEFTEKQTAAIHHQGVEMNQEMFDQILNICEEVGPDMDCLFYSLLDEYPEFMVTRGDRIFGEIKDVELPTLTPEESEKMREGLYAKIRAQFGDDAI